MQGYRRSAPNEQGTVNTQILPPWILTRWGDEALDTRARVEWDVEPAKDRLAEANSLEQTAKAGEALRKFLKKFGRELDINQLTNQFGVAMVPGQYHRTDGPAIEYANGYKWWYIKGQLHRTDGPAIEWADGVMK